MTVEGRPLFAGDLQHGERHHSEEELEFLLDQGRGRAADLEAAEVAKCDTILVGRKATGTLVTDI